MWIMIHKSDYMIIFIGFYIVHFWKVTIKINIEYYIRW